MADRDGGGHAADTPVGPDARDRLLNLITAELRVAWDAAIAAGADSATLAEIVNERRHLIESATPITEDDEIETRNWDRPVRRPGGCGAYGQPGAG